MLTKIYAALWIIIAFTAGVLYLIGYFSILTAVVYGFVAFGMIFMGMMCVLPSTIAHARPVRHEVPTTTQPQLIGRQPSLRERASAFRDDLMSSNGVEIRKPNFH